MRQKLAAHAPLLLLLLQLFLPLCFLVTRLFGYRTEVTSCPLHAALLAGATLFLTWLAVRHGEDTPWASALAAALLPTAAVAQSLVLLALGVGTRGSWSGPLFALVYGVCAWILLARHARPKALAVGASILSAALTLGLIFLGFIFMVFGSLGERSVMQTLSSPDGRYTAQVIDSDEGALGGATFVDVTDEGKTVDLGLYRIGPAPIRVYRGGWGESPRIEWRDENTLIINGTEYGLEDA